MNKYKAIVIDDEFHIREAMKVHLDTNCPEIAVCGMANSAEGGRKLLDHHEVDIIFLDISMPSEDGFSFLKSIDSSKYAIIFVTAYQEYALKALKVNAIDYLLKPVNSGELREAVTKAVYYLELRREKPEIMEVYEKSMINLQNQVNLDQQVVERITVTEQFGFRLVDLSEIIYMEAESNYTLIYLNSGDRVLSTKNLGDFDKMLEGNGFFRIHKSTMINLRYLKAFSSFQGNFAEMQNGTKLDVSRRKIIDFKNAVNNLSKIIT